METGNELPVGTPGEKVGASMGDEALEDGGRGAGGPGGRVISEKGNLERGAKALGRSLT